MNPTIWGPPTWIFLHTSTFSYPDTPNNEEKKQMSNLIFSLPSVLSCISCREQSKKHLAILPLTEEILSDKSKLIRWMIDFHNLVNVSTGKRKYSYKEVINIYQKMFLNESSNFNHIYILVFIIMIIVSMMLYIATIREKN